ncbi:MAG TPA: hypothetical protein VNG32_04775 [Candidatus Dormibacteraeota bacterium]|nr:hypothetical protein [Candidatus Dormibacteraeota bacterium]
MYSVLVLGLIPGTHIQISFVAWLALTIIVLLAGSVAWLEYKRSLSELWLPSHYPKHASQLHRRGV